MLRRIITRVQDAIIRLTLASHRGLSSLGLVLLFGVGACLVASLVVLPNLLVAFGMARR